MAKKLSERLSKMSDMQLLEHLQLVEEYLNEAAWLNPSQFEKHYKSHVLEEDEEFNPDNPKFVHMSEEEYRKMAEELSEAPADKALYKAILDKDGNIERLVMNTRSQVIGYMLKPDVGKYSQVERKAKVSITPQKYLPEGVSGTEFRTLVIYVDDVGKSEIVSCYLLRPRKLFGLFKYQYNGELPENQTKDKNVKESIDFSTIGKTPLKESMTLRVDTPYMMRNDGTVFEVKYANRRIADHPYIIRDPKNTRTQDAVDAIMRNLPEVQWFFDHTAKANTRNAISRFAELAQNYLVNDMLSSGKISEYWADKLKRDLDSLVDHSQPYYVQPEGGEYELLDAMVIANEAVNQEFLRFRTGKSVFVPTKLNVFFRVSSIGFDWSTLIDNFIIDNYSQIADITITQDHMTFKQPKEYSVKGKDIVHVSVDDWLRLGKDAVIESLFDFTSAGGKTKYFSEGMTVADIFWNCHPRHITEYVLKMRYGTEHLLSPQYYGREWW